MLPCYFSDSNQSTTLSQPTSPLFLQRCTHNPPPPYPTSPFCVFRMFDVYWATPQLPSDENDQKVMTPLCSWNVEAAKFTLGQMKLKIDTNILGLGSMVSLALFGRHESINLFTKELLGWTHQGNSTNEEHKHKTIVGRFLINNLTFDMMFLAQPFFG